MRVITNIDLNNPIFQKTFKKLAPSVLKEAKRLIGELILIDLDDAPAKLHLHSLISKQVKSAIDPSKKVSVYTIHITTNDTYKASFTFENNTVYFRACGEHDEIDKNP